MTAYLAGIAIAVNQFKVPPVMQILISDLHIDMATGGWLMSVFSVASVILAIPAAFLLTRLGIKVTGLMALGCTIVGAVIGALATNVTTLLVGRVIEGISVGLISVVAPTVISMWFEPQERGLPMGIWAAWVPVGNVIAFNVAHPLLTSFGWRAVWWFGILFALVALILYGLVVVVPPRPADQKDDPSPGLTGSFGRMLLNPSSWLLALAFGTFSFSMIGYNTWVPSFLTETLQLDTASASFYASLLFMAGIPANVVAGWMVDRVENRPGLLTVAFLITTIIFAWSFRFGSTSVAVLYMILLGFASNFIPTSVFTLAPETIDAPQFAGLGLAIVAVVSGLGSLVGPPFLGAVISGGNWTSGSTCVVIVMSIGLIASRLAWPRKRITR